MLLTTFLQKFPNVVFAVIVTLLAYQLALLTWSIVPEKKSALIWKPIAATNKQDDAQINTYNLKKQQLFGEKAKQEKKVVQQTSITNAPKTRLNLKLVGVVAATDPNYSSVIIDNRGKQSSYFMNSKIDDTNAVITQIYQDRIILEVAGEYQTLMLDGVEKLDQQQRQQNQGQRSDNRQSNSPVREQPTTVNLDRQELLSNPGKLTDYIQISPVRENDQVKGYRVQPGKDKTLFEEAGLENGDLAVELNGIDLTDTQQAITLMKEFPTMTEMALTVERDGQLHELYFSIP